MNSIFRPVATILTVIGLSTGAAVAAPTPIDLNTWSVLIPGGSWSVGGGGSFVQQTVNGSPTVFGGPDNFINKSFNGKFGGNPGSGDDDYIGFVFGYQNSNEFWLFDWKQREQSGTTRGFTLSYVTGGAAAIPFGNHHVSNAGYTVVEDNLGTGWANSTLYDFTLDYTSTGIEIKIDGGAFSDETIFDISAGDVTVPAAALSGGEFKSGQFGFYNYSQSQVRYEGFTEQAAVPEPSVLAVLGLGVFGIGLMRRRNRR